VTPLYPLQLALLPLLTGGGCSVGIVRSRTEAMEFFFFLENLLDEITRVKEGVDYVKGFMK
jgi:hypothetical protein